MTPHTGSEILEDSLRLERGLSRLGQTYSDLPLQARLLFGLSLEEAVRGCGLFYALCPVPSSGRGGGGRREEGITLFSPTSA